MSTKMPIFSVTDYGFDPQIDYLQVLEEARTRKPKRPPPPSPASSFRSSDSLHVKLQNALRFFKRKCVPTHRPRRRRNVHDARARSFTPSTMSGPLYITESRSGSGTPYWTARGPSAVPLAGSLTPAEKGEVVIPYMSLREMNMEPEQRVSTSAMPIYLVT